MNTIEYLKLRFPHLAHEFDKFVGQETKIRLIEYHKRHRDYADLRLLLSLFLWEYTPQGTDFWLKEIAKIR